MRGRNELKYMKNLQFYVKAKYCKYMKIQEKKEVYLPIISGILLLLWVFYSFNLFLPNNLIADEFIYLNLRHLDLPWIDFFFYDPNDFYGHGPLLPLIHTVLLKLSNNVTILRLFHLSFIPIIFLLTFSFKKKWSFNLIISLTLLLFHQTLWAQATLLFPEVIQVTLGILTFLLWKKKQFKFFMIIATLNIFLRESSLAFLAPLLMIDFTKKRLKGNWHYYALPLTCLLFHLGATFLGDATNPGWEQYRTKGFWVEARNMLITINYFIPPIGGPLFFVIFLLISFAQLNRVQRTIQTYRKAIDLFFLISLVLFLIILFGFEIGDSTPLTLTKLIYRSNGMGLISIVFFLMLGVPLALVKLSEQSFFFLYSSLLNIVFFLWYQAHAPREIILPFTLLIWFIGTLPDSSWKSTRYSTSMAIFLLFNISPYILKESKKDIYPLRVLNFNELKILDAQDKRFLQRISNQQIKFRFEDPYLKYLENSDLSPYKIKSFPEADLILSMYPHFNGQAIDQGAALFLYPARR